MTNEVANWEILIYAFHLLGAAHRELDVEDAFEKMYDLARSRVGWRTKPFPDYKKCSKALRDAEDSQAHEIRYLVRSRTPHRRQLSAEGQAWVMANEHRLSQALGVEPSMQKLPPIVRRAMLAVRRNEAFARWFDDGTLPDERWILASLFRCASDSPATVWSSRLQRLRGLAHASGEERICTFLNAIETAHPEWFAKENTNGR